MKRSNWMMGIALSVMAVTAACNKPATSQNAAPSAEATESFEVVTYAEGLEQPWGMAFLPDGRLLVTEKAGRLQVISKDGKPKLVSGTPVVADAGQGGLLGVAVDPDFAQNQYIYLSFSEPGEGGVAGTSVARAKLSGQVLTDLKVIWQQSPKVKSNNHWGSRIVFAPDGKLFITTGDRASFREKAQDLTYTFGKVIRINSDGTIPQDNPFVGRSDAKPEIWSYGHRNMQGAAINPATGKLWTNEHGAQGGDEINAPEAGKNYGWPVITWGVDYSGARIGEGTTKSGMEQPVHYWNPSIAPSGMLFYTGDAFPTWKGDLFIGSLKFQYLNHIKLDGTKVVSETKLLEDEAERIRDVVQGPDGLIYVAYDSGDGRIVRLQPK
ncbi:PQQ-dependent sugar dehydrogenase [Asticcacaulis sp. ZE23SCel15]|uniref:PQQ-dependent sugar dehydrogenase n=1 Tax=Asticcacaulis sp. ZE23SCel15 TaxID=3059027 RepID=UPI00266059D0|nr:PQQ-dependent sugar dehydrogenase [Asticcacaulis sp. ZE23SCel15]WKL58232.1 PQQ-dependent sugar dehydrogenase [Asticcacaulis sp. ZE23SCel15]